MRRMQLKLHMLAVVLAGCAVKGVQEEMEPLGPPAPPVIATVGDPFETVEKAAERLVTEPDAPLVVVDQPPPAPALWPRIVSRFQLSHCPDGSPAAQWAAWYASQDEYMERVFRRAGPWLHDIATQIELRELPGELALIPIVESAYDPFAYSHGRAAGSWQFLAGTAREFGLEINDWYDGRRDVYAATRAALDYFEYLSDQFDGDWRLALASYNAGPGRVSRAMARNATRGRSVRWNDLPLPRETLSYVPKVKGLSCLFSNPGRYGFSLPALDSSPQFAVVDLPGPTDIVIAAELAELDIAELVALNPGLSRHMTPPGGPSYLLVPPSRAEQLRDAVSNLPPAERTVWQEVRVNRGDTLSGLARRHDTTVSELRTHNNLNGDLLSVDQVLRLPKRNGMAQDPAYAARYQELARLQQRLLPEERFRHQVRPGESLWVIARRYDVSVADIRRWNGLGASSLIRPGQRLMIHGAGSAPSATPPVTEYTVRRGDSLWSIARRHQVAINDLMRWNGLNADSVLRPGQKLTIRRGSDA